MKKIDIYDNNKNLKSATDRIEESKISSSNKKTILAFKSNCSAEGLSVSRIIFYITKLQKIAEWLGKDFEQATKDDIIHLVERIENMEDYADWTKQNFRVTLKKFYKWLKNTDDEYPNEVKWIKTTVKDKNHKLPEQLLTEEDIKKLIEAASHPRDKALISVLYESGCRIGEIATLRLKHVEFDKHGAVLMVNGKTGARRVRIISSTSYLATWIENHPLKNDSDSPLWVGIGTKSRDEVIDYAAVRAMLRRTAEKTKIKKHVNPHIFRHSRATYLATHLTEAQMNEYLGWVQGSEMPSTYVHLSGRDVDKPLLKMYGMETTEEKEETRFKPKKCDRCKEMNPPTGKFCMKCGAVLDVKTAITLEDKMKGIDKKLAELLRDEKVQSFLMQRMKEIV